MISSLWLAPTRSSAQNTTKRLILKDGSYQIVTKWEIQQGGRVHYFSAERNDWEDVPSSMVDWNATNQYERDRLAGKESPEAQALDKEIQEDREAEDAKSPEVASGLRLPEEGGVYALDTYLAEPQLVPLDQSSGDINRDVKRNVLRAMINPVGGSKSLVELAGSRSKIQLHASSPAIYINLEPVDEDTASSDNKSPELPWDRFRIVKAEAKGDKRIVGAIKSGVTGKSKAEQQVVPTNDQQLGEDWVMVTPKDPLPPGEYALVELLGKDGMNSYVWDFGIHPNAPANMSVIRPEKKAPANSAPPTATDLKKRD